MNEPLLSVCLITYNHANYIKEAIDSVLNQKVDFSWELIIADDCSTDGTTKIIEEYKKVKPGLVTLIHQKTNVGAGENWIRLLSAPNSKYIAYLEGDDYWVDPLKLKKQVDFLEENPDFTACFHNVKIIDTNNEFSGLIYPLNRKTIIDLQDLLEDDYMKSCSIVFKNDSTLLKDLLDRKIPPDDTSLGYCLLSRGNKAKYFEEIMAVYRIHPGGTWSKLSADQQNEWVLKDFKQRYRYYFYNTKIKQGVKIKLLKLLRIEINSKIKKIKIYSALKHLIEFLRYKYLNFK